MIPAAHTRRFGLLTEQWTNTDGYFSFWNRQTGSSASWTMEIDPPSEPLEAFPEDATFALTIPYADDVQDSTTPKVQHSVSRSPFFRRRIGA